MWSTSSFKWQSETILKRFIPLLLDEVKAAALIIIILWTAQFASTHSSGACLSIFSLLHLPGAGTVYRSPYVLSTLCSAPHLESVPSALLRCHVISHCGFDYHLKTVKAKQTSFPHSFVWAQEWEKQPARKTYNSRLPINCFWVMFLYICCNIQWKWKCSKIPD